MRLMARALVSQPLLVLALFVAAPTAAATTFTVTPVADTYVNEASATTSYGTSTALRVDGSPVARSYLRFQVAGLDGSITSAVLRVYANSAQSTGWTASSVPDTTWSETGTTYANGPAVGTARGSSGAVATGTWTQAAVTAGVAGDGSISFALTTTSGTGLSLASRESANRPQLVITTQPGGGGGDVSAPSAPTGLTATATGPTSVALSWTAATDDVGVTGYRVQRDGADIAGGVTGTSYTDTGGAPASTYTYRVIALDAAGHTSAPSAPATVTTPAAGATATFGPAADAYVNQDQPSTNFGTATQLIADASPVRRSLLRFMVAGTAGSRVTSARLRLYCVDGSPAGGTVHGVASTTWSETGVTWSTAPAGGASVGSLGAVASGRWYEIDVTPLVTGDGPVSLDLASTNSDGAYYGSRQGTAAQAPQLVVQTTAAPATGLDVGAYWYGWYGSSGRHWQDGYVRHVLSTPQRPQLGEYDSRDVNVIATQLGWARQAGVDHLISSWWGQGSYEDVTTRDYLLASPAIGTTRIALLYESLALLPVSSGVITFDATAEAKLIADVDYMARTYFVNPHYERVDGKPVVYLYVTRIWRGDYAHAIATLRSTIRARYGYDLYLIGDEVDWDGSPVADRIRLLDAITAYTMYSDLQRPGWPADTLFLDGVRSRYTQFQAVAAANGVRFIPDAMPGFDDRGVRLAANHYVLPLEVSAAMPTGSWSLFSGMLDAAAPFIDASRPMLTVTSWNEWHEDTEIEPTAAAATSTGPATYTQGYAFPSHGTTLLDILSRFSAAHGG